MSASLYFYDLETSGIYPDSGRIMQFAGQRTDIDLNPIGNPDNILITLPKDSLPDPAAVLIHGVTPQQTILEGMSEAEFLKYFYAEIVKPETTYVGFNNIRFDDEFMRYLNYRNLYDPYAWSWENGCSRWDILDVVRLTRALRPDGIEWPVDENGANVNRLELLTKANKLEHLSAHDALSDVSATIQVARLIKNKQPKLYDYLFELRKKVEASKLVKSGHPFVYTSSHYPSAQMHTTVVAKVADHPDANCALVFDLRYDPSAWVNKTAEQIVDAWRYDRDRTKDNPPLPVKTMRLNRCPAIAPLGTVKDEATQLRLGLDLKQVGANRQTLLAAMGDFSAKLLQAVEILNQEQEDRQLKHRRPVDTQLYAGFLTDDDRKAIKEMHANESADKIRSMRNRFDDPRLKKLTSLYLARNYYKDLSDEERASWDEFVRRQLFEGGPNSRLALYFQRIAKLAQERTDARSLLLLEDLKLYGESLVPSDMG